jgi:hypothetical protein
MDTAPSAAMVKVYLSALLLFFRTGEPGSIRFMAAFLKCWALPRNVSVPQHSWKGGHGPPETIGRMRRQDAVVIYCKTVSVYQDAAEWFDAAASGSKVRNFCAACATSQRPPLQQACDVAAMPLLVRVKEIVGCVIHERRMTGVC